MIQRDYHILDSDEEIIGTISSITGTEALKRWNEIHDGLGASTLEAWKLLRRKSCALCNQEIAPDDYYTAHTGESVHMDCFDKRFDS